MRLPVRAWHGVYAEHLLDPISDALAVACRINAQRDVDVGGRGVGLAMRGDVLRLFKPQLQTEDNTDLPETDYMAVVNNLLHSLFSRCTIYLNGTQITQATELYPYRAYIETISTYGNDAGSSHLTMPWLLDEGNMLGGDGAKPERTNNGGFCARWNRLKESQTFEMYGRLHSDICNVPLFLLNGVKIQIKLTKAKKAFYLLSNRADTKSHFQISRSPIVRQENPSGSLYSRIT